MYVYMFEEMAVRGVLDFCRTRERPHKFLRCLETGTKTPKWVLHAPQTKR